MSAWGEFWQAFKLSLAVNLLMVIVAYFAVCFVVGKLLLAPFAGIGFRAFVISYLFISILMCPFAHNILEERDNDER